MGNIERLKLQIKKSEGMLANENFLAKASPSVIEIEKKKVIDFQYQLAQSIQVVNDDLNRFIQEPFITYFIQEMRSKNFNGEIYSPEWFECIYYPIIIDEEKEELLMFFKKGKIMTLFG